MSQDTSKGGSSGKKRVRFCEEHQIVEFQPEEKRSRDAMQQLEGEISTVSIEAEFCATADPAGAAARRARQRRQALLSLFDDTEAGREASHDDDLVDWDQEQAAEAEYEEPEERFSEAGIPIEPFHMREEREQGYFDEETGNYVKYKMEEEEDAWVDALPDAEVDREWLRRVLRGRAPPAAEGGGGGGEADLSPDQIRAYKEQILGLLRPKESVLQALRRLGNSRLPRPAPTSVETTSPGDTAPHPASKGPAPERAAAWRTPRAMPAGVKSEFDKLTEAGSLLMEAGEYDIHHLAREEIVHSLEGGSSALQLADSSGGGSSAAQHLAEHLLRTAANADEQASGHSGRAEALQGRDSRAATTAPADGEQDIFADDDTRRHREAAETAAAQHVQPGQAPVEAAPPGSASHDRAVRAPADPAAGATAPAPPLPRQLGAPGDLDGFSVDASTGYLYNQALGAYYDASSGMFGDAASGRWYRVDSDGRYTLVP